MSRNLLLIIFIICVPFTLLAQKRNIISNAKFEESRAYKNWRLTGNKTDISYSVETMTPIEGQQTALIEVKQSLANSWESMLQYFLPVTKGVAYQIKFKAKAEGTTKLTYEFCENHDPYTAMPMAADQSARGDLVVDSEVKEYVINTLASPTSDWNYKFSFHFGQQTIGAKIWIDDVEITQIDGDWDGNLIPAGDLDHGTYAGFDLNQTEAIAKVEIDLTNQINGNSIHIQKLSTSDNWWASNLFFMYWSNESVENEISFKSKAKTGSTLGQITIRTAEEPWGLNTPGDQYISYVDIKNNLSTTTINSSNSTGDNRKSKEYTDDWFGNYKVFSGLGDGATPAGFDVYIDDLGVREKIVVSKLEIFGAKTILTESTFSIKNITPTNASKAVEWSVLNKTGEALINGLGILTPLSNGTVIVKAISTTTASVFATMEVTVNGTFKPTSITVKSAENKSIINVKGGTLQLQATVFPENSINKNFVWTVAGDNATISNTGILTALTNGTVNVSVASTENTSLTANITITISNQVVTAYNQIEDTKYLIYPNPCHDFLTFQNLTEINHIFIIDINGREVLSFKNDQSIVKLAINTFKNGIYFIHLIDLNGISHIKKIIKE